MKKLFFILLLIPSLLLGQQVQTTIDGWGAYVFTPTEYASNPNKYYPLLLYFPGAGDTGPPVTDLLNYGPSKEIAEGRWNGEAVVGGVTTKFIVISIQCPSPVDACFVQPDVVQAKLNAIISSYRIDQDRMILTGISAGGFAADNYITANGNPTQLSYANRIAGIIAMSAVVQNYPYSEYTRYANNGGKWWGITGINDQRNYPEISSALNGAVPGSARVTYFTEGGGLHCCWNTFYNPSYTENVGGQTWNIYQWAAAQTLGNTNQPPVANAGPDQNIVPSSTTLTGSGSDPDGNIASYFWEKTAGPGGAIASPNSASTAVSGLTDGYTYTFKLTVTDNEGATGVDYVLVAVNVPNPLTANAGADFSEPDTIPYTILNGSGTGNNITYEWRNIQKPKADAWCANILHPTKASTQVIHTGAFSFSPTSTYKYELTVRDNAGNTAKDTVTVTKVYSLPAPPQSTGWRYATSADLSIDNNINEGDILITGANAEGYASGGQKSDIRYLETSGMKLVPGRKILIAAGKYREIKILIHKDSNTATPSNPAVITNYGGQVMTRYLEFSNLENIKITGEYNVANKTGNINFQGHKSGYAYSSGRYGIFVNNQYTSPSQSTISMTTGDDLYNVECSFIEAGHGGFAWVIGKLASTDLNNWKIHDCLLAYTHSEGLYAGRTSGDPQSYLNNWEVYNNRFVGCGNEPLQFSQIGQNNVIRNNVAYMGALNRNSPFEDQQIFAMQLGIRGNGANNIYRNIVHGAGGQLLSVITNEDPAKPTTGLMNYIRRNVFFATTGAAANFLGKQDAGLYKFTIDSNYTGYHVFNNARTYQAAHTQGTNSMHAWRTSQGNGSDNELHFTNNRYDSTKSTFLSSNVGVLTNANNTNNQPPRVDYVNTGWPDTMDIGRVSVWIDTVYNTFKDEYPNLALTRQNEPYAYATNEYVFHFGKFYRSKVDGNHGHPPAGVTDAWWELVTWNSSYLPPSDLRLVQNDFYNLQGIGLTDNIQSASNISPTANAGPDQTVNINVINVQLSGSGNDPDGMIASYSWTKISGPSGGTFSNASAASPLLQSPSVGTYVLRLTVTDNMGATATDDVSITVTANAAPVANAGMNILMTLPTNSVQLNGSGTDADGTIRSYSWTKISGPTYTITSSTVANPTISNLKVGTYEFRLTVTDNMGAASADINYPASDSRSTTDSRVFIYVNPEVPAGTYRIQGNVRIVPQ